MLEGEPWFVGKDVAMALGYERADNAIRTHVNEEDKLTHQISASGQNRNMILINESGLYSLIFSSKLPFAKAFKRWVTSEVLSSIRKTGKYGIQNQTMTIMEPENYLKAEVKRLEEELKRSNRRIDTIYAWIKLSKSIV